MDPVPPYPMLGRAFFGRDAAIVAREIIGMTLVHRLGGVEHRGRVVESEAYVGRHDLASHAAKGRTPRTEVMFGPAGHAYVYLVYGMHTLFNAVAGSEGDPQAVLIRAVEPVAHCLGSTNGPGRLCRALDITRAQHGADLCQGNLFFEMGMPVENVLSTPRIGIDYAGAWRDAPLRFHDPASPCVSRRPR